MNKKLENDIYLLFILLLNGRLLHAYVGYELDAKGKVKEDTQILNFAKWQIRTEKRNTGGREGGED